MKIYFWVRSFFVLVDKRIVNEFIKFIIYTENKKLKQQQIVCKFTFID